jgi:DNA-directed RNA polymerase subunit L
MSYQLPGSSATAASFEFLDEGHTLGNALRYIIMKKYVVSVIPVLALLEHVVANKVWQS